MTHYEVLGASRSATTAELRAAYRRAARESHPDRTGDATSDRMAAVNEAWRVLSDRDVRRRYDDELAAAERRAGSTSTGSGSTGSAARSARPPTSAPPASAPLVVHPPARFPWRFMAALLGLGVALVVAGLILYDPPSPVKPDGILRPGDCVALSPELEASEIACGDHDATVERLIPFGEVCPSGTQPYRDRQGLGTACVIITTP